MADGISDFIYRSDALLSDSSHLPIEVLHRLKLNAKYLLQCKNSDDNKQKLKKLISKVDERIELINNKTMIESEQHSSSSSQGINDEGSTLNVVNNDVVEVINLTVKTAPSLDLTNKSNYVNTKYNAIHESIEPNSSTSTTSAVKLQSLLKQQKVSSTSKSQLYCVHKYFITKINFCFPLLMTGSYYARG